MPYITIEGGELSPSQKEDENNENTFRFFYGHNKRTAG